ncbi:hypothetical protein VU11_03760 [Desulfobulbus sp. US2]|nr:hypothetical protein [Desulfobulbus sp. US4]MCW5207776.1 hypothetical protein [Desulfobulbus sp. US2]MCW5214488.1 hypothetical protein [Desulfobulbus sp. US5]WLE97632.1 MAG: hypothetical protein QTN59_02090 [Candidatus Electrothrix communis]
MKLSVIGLVAVSLLFAGSAFAVDIEAAKTATASCNGCHSGAMAVKFADVTNKDAEAIKAAIVDGLDTDATGVMPKQDLGDQLDNVVEWIAAGAPESE